MFAVGVGSKPNLTLQNLSLQIDEFAQTLGLGAADGDFGLLLVIHAQLVGTLEPGDDLADVIDIDEEGAVGAPELAGIEIVE